MKNGQTKQRKRIKYIDALKGIGIFAVVLSHTTNDNELLRTLLFSFHMPLFFIISGYLYKKPENIKIQIKKIFDTLIIPYIIFSFIDIIFYLLWNFSCKEPISLYEIICGVTFFKGSMLKNIPLWFFLILAMSEVVFYFLQNKKIIIKIFILMLFIYIGYFVRSKNPFGFGIIPRALIFIIIGDILKNVKMKKKYFLIFSVFAFVFWTYLSIYNGFANLYYMWIGNNYALYILNGVLGTIWCCAIAMLIEKDKIINYIGRNTTVILCLHYYVVRFFIPKIASKLCIYSFLFNHIYGQVLVAIVTSALMIPIIYISNKYIPAIFGHKKA